MSEKFVYSNRLDVSEHAIWIKYPEILGILLTDRSSKKNIIWGTDNYIAYGKGFGEFDYIDIKLITGKYKDVIKPRILKSVLEKKKRIKDKAEVFTPSWICNQQNNLIDNAWFGYKGTFNIEHENGWKSTKNVEFKNNKNFKEYISEERIEITCGEAPYLVSRYDTTTGQFIEVHNRIGLLDRKLRVLNENVNNENEWIELAKKAYQSSYGYDYQGDNVLIARENLLITFIDFYVFKFNKEPAIDILKEIATIISWNIWQMDGLKFVIPNSCHKTKSKTISLLGDEDDEEMEECQGCVKNNAYQHNGIYCIVKDWKENKIVQFLKLFRGKINA